MACPELHALTLSAIRIGETNPPDVREPVVALCLRALRHLAAESTDRVVQDAAAQGLWRILTDGEGLEATQFGDAINAILDCVAE